MSTRNLRFALVGCGDIGVLRASAVTRVAGCHLVIACDVDSVKAGAVAAKAAGARVLSDWREAIRSDDVDAVIISTPPVLHEEICVAALEYGKHVLCEKPLARTPAECRAMVDAAKRTGRLLATGFNYRFYPSFAKARELLDSGIIGELDHIRAYGGYSATAHNQPWVHDVETVGGGALRDIGIHLIDLTHDFLGDVVEVAGQATGTIWNYPGCEDNGVALLRSSRGRMATVQASWTEWRKYQFRLELVGARGCIEATCFPMMTRVTWAAERAGRTQRKTDWFLRTVLGEKVGSYRWVVVESFVREFEEFAKLIEGQPSRVASGEDGARAVEIAFEATRGLTDAVKSEIAPATGAVALPSALSQSSAIDAPRLSVVVLPFGSTDLGRCLTSLEGQEIPDLEVVVVHDATLDGIPALRNRFPGMRFIGQEGIRHPAELRAIGARAANGGIVAFMEGHCIPSAHWCATILQAHQASHAAVGGPIEKGMPEGRDTDTALNWSIYLVDYSRYMLPYPEGPTHSLSDCNVAYKRSALEATRGLWEREFHENVVNEALRSSGAVLWFDPRMMVWESRELTLGDALRDRYSFGRLFGSTRVTGVGFPKRVALAAAALLMPPLLAWRVARNALSRGKHRGQVARASAHLVLVSGGWLVGEAVGYLTGSAGRSVASGAPQPTPR